MWSLAAVCDWGRGWIPADFFRAMAWPLALETLGLMGAGIWLARRIRE
jgi:hypothetical protein